MTENRLINVLTFSTLFPNPLQQAHGIFVWNRLQQLLETGLVKSQVIAPVAWFPSRSKLFGSYGRLGAIPKEESRNGVKILHPRYLLIPKIGMTSAPLLMALSMKSCLANVIDSGFDFDIIDAHYYYPDGVAAAILGKWFNKPVIITARGTDINLIPNYRMARSQIKWASKNSAGSIAVCEALKERMINLGINGRNVTVLRNGVDLNLFFPCDRNKVRQRFKWEGRVLLSVGLLIERKGHHLLIEMLRYLSSEYKLVIVGEGPMRDSLERQIKESGFEGRVSLVGARNQSDLVDFYGAADALILASSREGMANVLLEALACGTPVVATNTWGTPEVVSVPVAGVLSSERTPKSLAKACEKLFEKYPDRELTRKYAEAFSWSATTNGQIEIFRSVLGK